MKKFVMGPGLEPENYRRTLGKLVSGFKEILKYLENKKESKIVFGLDRVKRVLDALGKPQDKLRVIHVAGTNGKGSVCQMLYSVFLEAGFPVGLYSSPHLFDVRERISHAGSKITREDFCKAGQRILLVPGHEELSYFEFMTCLAFVYFKAVGADPVVLETGLGGRLDATNVVRHPLISVITSIGLDHTTWLGSSLQSIAAEKAGIFKPGALAVLGQMPLEIHQYLAKKAEDRKASLIKTVGHDAIREGICQWEMGFQEFAVGDDKMQLPFLGRHQLNNAYLALQVLEALRDIGLKISNENIASGFRKSRLDGRWDLRFKGAHIWVFDVAHNVQAIEQHLNTAKLSPWREAPKLLIAGFLKDKDYAAMLKLLAPHFKNFWFVEPLSDRACSTSRLIECLDADDCLKVKVLPSVSSAMELAKADSQFLFISVLGSFRVIGPALCAFQENGVCR